MAFRYYAPRLGVSTAQAIYAECSIRDPRQYLRRLDGLRGERRVWIVMTHEIQRGEREFILGYLDAVGTQLNTIEMQASSNRTIERASVHLYDLRRASRAVDAESFPLPAPMRAPSAGMLKWGCYGVTGGEPER
jgi:hypothetical protein